MNSTILIINNTGAPPVLAGILEKAGYAVDTARNTFASLDMLERNEYSAIISLERPEAASDATCETVRAVSACPLIIISPNADTQRCVQAIRAGADCFLRKPFGPLELMARLKSLIQRSSIQPSAVSYQARG